MLIWGKSNTKLKETYYVEMDCTVCKHNIFLLHGIQRYGHLWFVPLFPGEKIFFLSCHSCSGTVSYSDLKILGEGVASLKFKNALGSYVGWLIISSIVFVIAVMNLFSSSLK